MIHIHITNIQRERLHMSLINKHICKPVESCSGELK